LVYVDVLEALIASLRNYDKGLDQDWWKIILPCASPVPGQDLLPYSCVLNLGPCTFTTYGHLIVIPFLTVIRYSSSQSFHYSTKGTHSRSLTTMHEWKQGPLIDDVSGTLNAEEPLVDLGSSIKVRLS